MDPSTPDPYEEALSLVKQRADDIDGLMIPVKAKMQIGTNTFSNGVAVLEYCGGDRGSIDLETAERLINDGLLFKLGIKIRLQAF